MCYLFPVFMLSYAHRPLMLHIRCFWAYFPLSPSRTHNCRFNWSPNSLKKGRNVFNDAEVWWTKDVFGRESFKVPVTTWLLLLVILSQCCKKIHIRAPLFHVSLSPLKSFKGNFNSTTQRDNRWSSLSTSSRPGVIENCGILWSSVTLRSLCTRCRAAACARCAAPLCGSFYGTTARSKRWGRPADSCCSQIVSAEFLPRLNLWTQEEMEPLTLSACCLSCCSDPILKICYSWGLSTEQVGSWAILPRRHKQIYKSSKQISSHFLTSSQITVKLLYFQMWMFTFDRCRHAPT